MQRSFHASFFPIIQYKQTYWVKVAVFEYPQSTFTVFGIISPIFSDRHISQNSLH